MASGGIASVVLVLGLFGHTAGLRSDSNEGGEDTTWEIGALPEMCPLSVEDDGKDQCRDKETGEAVLLDCCSSLHECRADLAELQSGHVTRLAALMQSCAVSAADVLGASEDLARDKVCTPSCTTFIAAVPSIDTWEAFHARCHSKIKKSFQLVESLRQQAVMMGTFVNVVQEMCVQLADPSVTEAAAEPTVKPADKTMPLEQEPQKVGLDPLAATSAAEPANRTVLPRQELHKADPKASLGPPIRPHEYWSDCAPIKQQPTCPSDYYAARRERCQFPTYGRYDWRILCRRGRAPWH